MTVQEIITSTEFKPISQKLHSFALKLTGDRDKALDLYQDTIELLLNKYGLYREGNFSSWCMKLMHSTFINQYNRNKRFVSLQGIENMHDHYCNDGTNNTLDHRMLRSGMVQLPDAEANLVVGEIDSYFKQLKPYCRDVYRDFIELEMSHQELSDKHGPIPATIKTMIWRASTEMKRLLTPVYNHQNTYKKSHKSKQYRLILQKKNAEESSG